LYLLHLFVCLLIEAREPHHTPISRKRSWSVVSTHTWRKLGYGKLWPFHCWCGLVRLSITWHKILQKWYLLLH